MPTYDHPTRTTLLVSIAAGLLTTLACTLTSPPSNNDRIIGTAIAEMPVEVTVQQTIPAGMNPSGEPQGHIVFTCFIGGYDEICTINADGSNFQQLTNIEATDWYAEYSPNGSLISFSSRRDDNFEIYLMNGDGSLPRRLTENLGSNYAPTISPDGSRIVFTSYQGPLGEIWTMGIDGTNPTMLTDEGDSLDPIWSPDGTQIAYASTRNGKTRELFVMNADGSNIRSMTTNADVGGRNDWSPDGSQLAFYAGPDNEKEVFIINVDGTNLRQLTDGGNNKAPAFSPDGLWLTFTSEMDEDGDNEIFIMRVDGSDVRQLTFNQRPDWQSRWGP